MRMNFGVFLSPYHGPGQNPTLAIQRDLQMMEALDALGFEEAWIGEHHSGGFELISSPEVFIAAASQRTQRLRFGTGVASVPYHHPLILADRMVLLDHITRGRVMFGMGPGSLVTDARMLGMDYNIQRQRLEEGMGAIAHLLTNDEPLTMETEWFKLCDAQLQLSPFNPSGIELAVAAVRSPTGPRLAGRYGAGLLGVAATDDRGGFEYLSKTWQEVESAAAEHGQTVDRRSWRLIAPMHIAPTLEQAIEDVRYGYANQRRFESTGPFRIEGAPDIEDILANTDHETLIHESNARGYSVIGTPEMARKQIQRLWDKSGGFGCLLIRMTDMADPAATLRSLELFARQVMPEFQGSMRRPLASWLNMYGDRDAVGSQFRQAQDMAIAKYAEKVG